VVGVNQEHTFCLDMLSVMDKVLVSKLYFSLFESVLREALSETPSAKTWIAFCVDKNHVIWSISQLTHRQICINPKISYAPQTPEGYSE